MLARWRSTVFSLTTSFSADQGHDLALGESADPSGRRRTRRAGGSRASTPRPLPDDRLNQEPAAATFACGLWQLALQSKPGPGSCTSSRGRSCDHDALTDAGPGACFQAFVSNSATTISALRISESGSAWRRSYAMISRRNAPTASAPRAV
jgi:hypothetical protein